jgi:transcriptional accessory protein Tex/SPT6
MTEISVNERQINEWSEKYNNWKETLEDCIKELQRPGLDPRDE